MCDHSLALYALSDAASIAIGIGDRGDDHGLLRAGVMGLQDYLEKQVVVWSISIMSKVYLRYSTVRGLFFDRSSSSKKPTL